MTRVFKQISTLSVHLNTFEHRKSRARAAKTKELERVGKERQIAMLCCMRLSNEYLKLWLKTGEGDDAEYCCPRI